jgi:hypothetical protein
MGFWLRASPAERDSSSSIVRISTTCPSVSCLPEWGRATPTSSKPRSAFASALVGHIKNCERARLRRYINGRCIRCVYGARRSWRGGRSLRRQRCHVLRARCLPITRSRLHPSICGASTCRRRRTSPTGVRPSAGRAVPQSADRLYDRIPDRAARNRVRDDCCVRNGAAWEAVTSRLHTDRCRPRSLHALLGMGGSKRAARSLSRRFSARIRYRHCLDKGVDRSRTLSRPGVRPRSARLLPRRARSRSEVISAIPAPKLRSAFRRPCSILCAVSSRSSDDRVNHETTDRQENQTDDDDDQRFERRHHCEHGEHSFFLLRHDRQRRIRFRRPSSSRTGRNAPYPTWPLNTAPYGLIFPILLAVNSVNQRLPSEPVVM